MDKDRYNNPQNENIHPPTTKSADGSTVLYKFQVEAIIYAPTLEEAKERLLGANIYLDAARVKDPNYRKVSAKTK